MGYPKQVYDQARQLLEQRREEARTLTQKRRDQAYAKLPELVIIEGKMAQGASSIARMVILDPDNAEENIHKLAGENLALQQRRRELLEQNGFPGDYLETQYACSKCKDTGYVGNVLCHCLKSLLEKQAYEQLSQVSPLMSCTFDSFTVEYYPDVPENGKGVSPRQRMRDTLTFLRQYAASFTPSSQSLLMMGNTGLGKTHLSLAVAGAVLQGGYGVIYTPVQKLMDTLEADKFARDSEAKENYAENIRAILQCDLLVLDDLGTEFLTQFTQSVLYNIINSRLIESRPTIISTNLRVGDIEDKYSQRMVSRLICGYKVLPFSGKDIRMIRMAEGQ